MNIREQKRKRLDQTKGFQRVRGEEEKEESRRFQQNLLYIVHPKHLKTESLPAPQSGSDVGLSTAELSLPFPATYSPDVCRGKHAPYSPLCNNS